MNLLSGEYDCKLDPKGRLVLPAKVKGSLPQASAGQLVLVRGFEPCLVLYPLEAWRVIHDKVMALDEFNEEYRQFQRNFFRGMTEVELDSIGRFMLPGSMRRYAGLEKEAIIVGLGNRCEIWDTARYDEYLIKDQQSFSKLAQKFLTNETGPGGSLAA
ncbi:division/cell wall cluster transcriptional repressor MraZ [Microvirga sp. STR05]|uniref:Transcriptional regulator MraZ n=2 Tax=Hymenobacter TaxID=89966 RepID=A0A7G7W4B4_9BACT|nr:MULTISPECIES: division/cell wall cluster transcriptional repressor MraZ [Hymenobacter]MBD2715421.1 division/cell wall cluster transcriptional repressor MraZ [Hymenobacter duratus]MBR7950329.1 division/cell wall cluster transcriptional repressor MraZ [Microvirga sp. STR05]QNH61207.1 division/cell wall cluster transcriptional repressor MraZ [Hymenobacter sediminicola]